MDTTDNSLERSETGSHPNDVACIFCMLISDDSANWVAKEDRAVAFFPLPDTAIAPGLTLVIPRSHTSNGVLDVDPEDLVATMSLVQRVSNAMLANLGASGVCVLNASGPELRAQRRHGLPDGPRTRWMATPESYSPMRSVCPPPRLKAVRNDGRRVPNAVALKDHRLLGEGVTTSMSRRFELDVMAQRVTFGAGPVEHLPAEFVGPSIATSSSGSEETHHDAD